MLVCLECGHVFDEDSVRSGRGYIGECWGQDCYEDYVCSPCCSGDFAETYECDCCGEWITGTYIKTEDGDRICENCYCTYEIGEEE